MKISNFKFLISKKSGGFTLIELMVVIGIITIISSVLIATVDPVGQFQKAQDGRRKSDLAQIQRMLEAYYQDNGTYPANPGISPFPGSSNNCTRISYKIKSQTGTTIDWGAAWVPYANKLPVDNGSKTYIYYVSCDGQSYYLYASLDRGSKDPQVCIGTNNICSNVPTSLSSPGQKAMCGSGTSDYCNYGATSPNTSP